MTYESENTGRLAYSETARTGGFVARVLAACNTGNANLHGEMGCLDAPEFLPAGCCYRPQGSRPQAKLLPRSML